MVHHIICSLFEYVSVESSSIMCVFVVFQQFIRNCDFQILCWYAAEYAILYLSFIFVTVIKVSLKQTGHGNSHVREMQSNFKSKMMS